MFKVNGRRLEREKVCVLRDGDEVGLGFATQSADPSLDYRYVYRQYLESPPSPLTGIHAHYDIDSAKELGRGTYATVVRAVQRAGGDVCAVKMITWGSKIPSIRSLEYEKMFREIEIMRGLQHPNIVSLRESFIDEQKICECTAHCTCHGVDNSTRPCA
jgi:ser/thr/tyr protein kinase RAD53